MPEMNNLNPALPPRAPAQASGRAAARDATQENQGTGADHPFARMLHGKVARDDAKEGAKSGEKMDKGDKSGNGEDTDEAAQVTTTADPQTATTTQQTPALPPFLAAQLEAARACGGGKAAGDATGAIGGEAGGKTAPQSGDKLSDMLGKGTPAERKAGGDPRAALDVAGADRDARKPAIAGPGEFAARMGDVAAAKDGTQTDRSGLAALLDHLRPDSGGKHAATPANDSPSTSTLAMLMPANQTTETQNTAAVTRPATLIQAPVGSPMFAEEAAQRVSFLAKSGVERAEIRVSPPDMGPIQVSIDMKQNEASINFVVTQTDTRVAVEDSLHRLEEMLADSGISLGQASVNQQDAGQGQGGAQGGARSFGASARGTARGDGVNGVEGAAAPVARTSASVRGLVDTFA